MAKLLGEVVSQSGRGEGLPPSQSGSLHQQSADEGAEEHHLGAKTLGVPAVQPDGRVRPAEHDHDAGHAVPETKS